MLLAVGTVAREEVEVSMEEAVAEEDEEELDNLKEDTSDEVVVG